MKKSGEKDVRHLVLPGDLQRCLEALEALVPVVQQEERLTTPEMQGDGPFRRNGLTGLCRSRQRPVVEDDRLLWRKDSESLFTAFLQVTQGLVPLLGPLIVV